MENRRSVDDYKRETDSIMEKVDDLQLQVKVLAEKVNYVAATNSGLKEVTDGLVRRTSENSKEILATGNRIKEEVMERINSTSWKIIWTLVGGLLTATAAISVIVIKAILNAS